MEALNSRNESIILLSSRFDLGGRPSGQDYPSKDVLQTRFWIPNEGPVFLLTDSHPLSPPAIMELMHIVSTRTGAWDLSESRLPSRLISNLLSMLSSVDEV